MTLKLRVTGYDAQHMGAVAEHEFGEGGGSIGRGPDNDWILPDPDRVISGTHAVIRFSSGEYYVQDASTNGTLLNSMQMSKGDERPLSSGDVLKIGKFDISVEVAALAGGARPPVEPQQPNTSSPAGADVGHAATLDPLELFGGGSQSNPVDLPPEDFDFSGNSSQPDHSPPEEMGFQAPTPTPDPQPMPSGDSDDFAIPDDWNATGLSQSEPEPEPEPESEPEPEPVQRPTPSVTQQTGTFVQPKPVSQANTMSASGQADNRGGIQEMLRAAGVPPEAITEETYQVLGQVLQVVVQGLVDVLRARAHIKDEFRVSATRLKPVENNPLKFSINAPDAMHNLFGKQNPGFQSPVDAFQDGFEDIKAHQMAMIAGMRAAYEKMLDYFNPDGLEAEFDKGLKRSVLGGVLNKTKYWDLYEDLYKHLEHDPESSFHRLFGDEFGRAYEEQMERLSNMRHK